MHLRPSLTPPDLDECLVAHLAALANSLDGAAPGQWEDDLAEFNRLAGTAIPFGEFQGIHGGEDHADYVRRVLRHQPLSPEPNLTRAEMTEIISRIMAGDDDEDFYLQLFEVNCRHPAGTDLIFYPDDVPELPTDQEPTAEQIAMLALPDRP